MIEARWSGIPDAFALTAEEFYRRLARMPWINKKLNGQLTDEDVIERQRELWERKQRRKR